MKKKTGTVKKRLLLHTMFKKYGKRLLLQLRALLPNFYSILEVIKNGGGEVIKYT